MARKSFPRKSSTTIGRHSHASISSLARFRQGVSLYGPICSRIVSKTIFQRGRRSSLPSPPRSCVLPVPVLTAIISLPFLFGFAIFISARSLIRSRLMRPESLVGLYPVMPQASAPLRSAGTYAAVRACSPRPRQPFAARPGSFRYRWLRHAQAKNQIPPPHALSH